MPIHSDRPSPARASCMTSAVISDRPWRSAYDSNPCRTLSRTNASGMRSSLVQDLSPESASGLLAWSPEAAARLESMPEFARPMAKSGIEKFAKERGLARIDLQVLDEASEFFGR